MSDSENSLRVPLHAFLEARGQDLDGSVGQYRGAPDDCDIQASNDLEAVERWLYIKTVDSSTHTQRTYRKEAERLLAWSLTVAGKALSDLSSEDYEAYLEFLKDPQPRETWCGPSRPRDHAQWKPFVGPLSDASRRQSYVVLYGLIEFLSDCGYLRRNPMRLLQGKRKLRPRQYTEPRYLHPYAWKRVRGYLDSLPEKTQAQLNKKMQYRIVFDALFYLLPRRSELANAMMSDFKSKGEHWYWQVNGKGNVTKMVPVVSEMQTILREYRQFIGLTPMPRHDDNNPLIRTRGGKKGITDSQIYRIVTDTCSSLANLLIDNPMAPERDRQAADLLRQASPHWVRHTGASYLATILDTVQLRDMLRHANISTSSIYTHTEHTALWHAANSAYEEVGNKLNTKMLGDIALSGFTRGQS